MMMMMIYIYIYIYMKRFRAKGRISTFDDSEKIDFFCIEQKNFSKWESMMTDRVVVPVWPFSTNLANLASVHVLEKVTSSNGFTPFCTESRAYHYVFTCINEFKSKQM
jgi:hypothetical protein